MTIAWTEMQIKPVCVAERRADISATVKNDDLNDGYVETFQVKNAVIGTAPEKLAVINQLWNKYQEYLARKTAVEAWIDTAVEDGLANLNGRL